MKIGTRLGLYTVAAFFAAGALTACAPLPQYVPADAPTAVLPMPAKRGDFWEYAVRDAYTGASRGLYRYEVSSADGESTVIDVYRDGQRVDAWVFAPGWNPREMPLTNLQRFRYDPPFPAYDYPLQPGKSWYRVVNATDPATRKTYRVHVRAKVLGWQRIRTIEGEHDALRVERYVYAGNAEFFNSQEEIVQTDWYAPAVGYIVRSEASSKHVDTSRSGGPRRPLTVHGDWLVAELTRYSVH